MSGLGKRLRVLAMDRTTRRLRELGPALFTFAPHVEKPDGSAQDAARDSPSHGDAPRSETGTDAPALMPEEEIRALKADMEAEEKRSRHVLCPDFADNPEAAERFRQWARTSELTRGSNGKLTYKALSKALGVGRITAGGFYRDPATITKHASMMLRLRIGDAAYFDMVHGAGAYERYRAAHAREEAIAEMEREFSAAMDHLRECSPDAARACLPGLKIFTEMARAHAPERGE